MHSCTVLSEIFSAQKNQLKIKLLTFSLALGFWEVNQTWLLFSANKNGRFKQKFVYVLFTIHWVKIVSILILQFGHKNYMHENYNVIDNSSNFKAFARGQTMMSNDRLWKITLVFQKKKSLGNTLSEFFCNPII